jgi:hypothetical protein
MICIKRANQRLYAQSDPKVTSKWPQCHRRTPKSDPKSDIKLTSGLYKIIKIYWESRCLLKMNINIPKVTPQSSQSDPKVAQSQPHIPKGDPKPTLKKAQMPQKCSGLLWRSFGWRNRARLDVQKALAKCIFPVYEPA